MVTVAYSAEDLPSISGEVVVSSKPIIGEVIELMKYTREILMDLDDGEKYGEVSWPNSITIGSAIESINGVLGEDPIFTVDDVKSYEKDVVDYFTTYIEEDLNAKGKDIYKNLQSIQDGLFLKIYAMYDSNYKVGQEKQAPKSN